LLNGKYIESAGAIIAEQESPSVYASRIETHPGAADRSWDECSEDYYRHRKTRGRQRSLADAASRLNIAERILKGYREDAGLPEGGRVRDYTTLEALEYLQDRLLAGDESRYDLRSPMTVNTMMGAVMAFVRYCHIHGWVDRVPPLAKLDVDEVMKGRPITGEEFDRMVETVPDVVGERSAASWKYVLDILWESAFRVADVMTFSWDDERRIHPVWPRRKGQYPTLVIPSAQKNRKAQEIPMLPGLEELLKQTPKRQRRGWVVNPLPIDYQIRSKAEWFKPTPNDLAMLAEEHNNCAIARACGVTETTVRKWLANAGICRGEEFDRHNRDIASEIITEVRRRAERLLSHPARRTERRLSKERVSRIVGMIGKQAGIVVQQADEEAGRRLKYASAHDLRRGCAQRLINAGISAETLKLVLRHKDFSTTERFCGATRAAQSAAEEIYEKLGESTGEQEPHGGKRDNLEFTEEERRKLKALLNSL